MPWIGPASRSWRDGRGRVAAPLVAPAAAGRLLTAALTPLPGEDFLPEALRPPDRLEDTFLAEGFATAFLRDGFLAVPDADFLLTFLVDFLVGFFVPAFLAADFADFFAAGFARVGVFFFFEAFFADDFFALILCLLPAVFLLAVDLRDAAVFLPVPARFCFLLAAFFAGMFNSCRSEKNAELYIGCLNMEAQNSAFFRGPEQFSGCPPALAVRRAGKPT